MKCNKVINLFSENTNVCIHKDILHLVSYKIYSNINLKNPYPLKALCSTLEGKKIFKYMVYTCKNCKLSLSQPSLVLCCTCLIHVSE